MKPMFIKLLLLLCLAAAQAQTFPPFPQSCSDHPLYPTSVGRDNPTIKAQFDAAIYLMDQYEFPNRVAAAVGFKLLSTANKDKAVSYTSMDVALSPMDLYVVEVHYSATLLQGTDRENDEAFENYLFANLVENNFAKFESTMKRNLAHYKDFPQLQTRVQKHMNSIPRLSQQYQPYLKDALMALDYFKDVPSDKALATIESTNSLLNKAFKQKMIPNSSYTELLYFTGRGLTHHSLISEKVNQTYVETLARPDLYARSIFNLADRYYINNKKKDNRSVVEVIDLALSRKRELSKPQLVSLLAHKALALQQMQSYETYQQTLVELKPLLKNLDNPTLLVDALMIITVMEMVEDKVAAANNVARLEGLLKNYPYLRGENQATVTSFRNQLNNVSTVTADTDTAGEYFELSLRKLAAQDYKGMIPLLLKAKELMDEKRKAGGIEVEKETDLLYSRILRDLVGSHVKMGEAGEALYFAELFKNKELSILTNSEEQRTATVKQIQNSLAADEALIYYVGTGTLDDTAFFNFLITREKVSGGFFDLTKPVGELFQFLPEHIAAIEKKLAAKELRTVRSTTRPPYGPDYMAQSGDMRIYFDLYRSYLSPEEEMKQYLNPKIFEIFSNQLWEYLIPGVKYMEGKTKLIICPAGDLSFIPFEVVRNTNTGKLLVEDYEISYTPSATVLVNQRAEPKKVFKKNILAFGDAKYSLRKDTSFPVKSIADVKRMQLAVQNSISKNENLDYAFAGLQGEEPMKYLIGTKNEVDAIKLLVPKTEVRMDAMMTENELKKLSKSGALNDYKVIHLASHASVHPYIFELSAIAMSVNESPVDGEDGMITVDEMKELDMNPELVMLSACQTGLGRITTGDTVQGLNNSLLQAGADATLTSLWSVNDYATSIFVKEFYDKVFNKNIPYKTAVTQVKREFLAGKYGEQLKHPEYWAPFIYYGK